jgi:dTDP-4-dehydrorhamnose reductase
MPKPIIAVSGKNGQLGSELQQLAVAYPHYEFVFASRDELDLTSTDSIKVFFSENNPRFFINCAAYTAVDKAEQEQELAYTINAEAVGTIAQLCARHNTTLIHISTDYVFNGTGTTPYKPNDETDPINYYGYSKWLGEKLALENCDNCIIIRTSWVYSNYGNNFVKTMIRLMKERNELGIVNDQLGSPTYASDLAEAILKVISKNTEGGKGIYHYSNEGIITWFNFALAIKEHIGSNCEVKPITTSQFPTPAKRPRYSVLNKDKIKAAFNITTPYWKNSLEKCMSKLV